VPHQLRSCVLCAALLASLSVPSWSQDVTGELEGWVVDTSGAPLAEAQVTAEGPRLQGARTANSDPRGYFRILALVPGRYTVRVHLIGRRPVALENVTVALGQTTSLGLVRLEPESFELPEIVVSGERPIIDPTSTALATNLGAETFTPLPVDRNYRSIVALAPQANTSFFGDETNIAGSSGSENAYFIDGVNVTDVDAAATSVNLPYNFVQEIQIKSGGYEAEYGRAQGGIVNVVTPTGGNTFGGEVYAFLTNDELRSRARLGLNDVALGEFSQYDVGASVGGPIARDRAWFYAAYNPTFERRDASVPGSGVLRDSRTVHLLAGKVTWKAAATTDVTFTMVGDPSRHDPSVTSPPTGSAANPDVVLGNLKEGGVTLSLQGRTLVRPNLLLHATLSRSEQVSDVEGSTQLGREEPRLDDYLTRISSGGFGGFSRNRRVRTAAQATASLELHAHAIKLGLEYEDNFSANDARANWIERHDDNPSLPYTWVRDSGSGRAHNRIPTVYGQDSWRITRRLRLNAGLRWEGQYFEGTNGRLAQTITDQIQPRAGVIYSPGELGTQRLFASWGRFYEQVPVLLATTYYGEAQQISIAYPQDPRVSTAGADTSAFTLGAPRVDGLQGQSYDEVTVGYERQIGRHFKAGARGIHRALRWAIEDGLGATGRFVVGNLGRGELSNVPKARRRYTALELTFERLGDARLTFLASYVLSRSWGNYTGLFASDISQTAPNITAQFDFVEQTPRGTGLLPNDRTHVLKFFGAYQFDFGVTTGTSLVWESGTPLSEYGGLFFRPYWSFLQPRGSVGRTPAIWDLNLRFTYLVPVRAHSRAEPQLVLDLFHVGSPRRAVTIDQVHYFKTDETGQQIDANVNYGKVTQYQQPMSARLGLLVGF
jgi:Carboxypeptidase regulatory-like domain